MNPVIEMHGIKKSLGGREILKGIDLEVNSGDIFGYLGSNGAGKTSTIRILLDLFRPDSGKARILGKATREASTRLQVGFVLSADGLYNNLSPLENLVFYAKLYGVYPKPSFLQSLLEQVGLDSRAEDRVGSFSRGMRQRLAIARALVHDPGVLILDEPLSGIDPSGQIEIRKILLQVVRERNKTLFFSSHNLDEVERLCNRIALLDLGEIRLQGDLEKLMREQGGGRILIETKDDVSAAVQEKWKRQEYLGFQGIGSEGLSFLPREDLDVPDVITAVSAAGIRIQGAARQKGSLQELYATLLNEREGQK